MFLKKILNSKIYLVLLFSILFLITRVPSLSTDAINPDGVNWHYRSEQFVVGLKTMQLEKTYQHYHPGVTLMWIVGPTVEIVKQVTGEIVYDHLNFLTFHFYAKLAVILVQLFLSIFGIFILAKLFEHLDYQLAFLKSVLVFTLFTFEPFFLGNSRLLHMDVLLTLFLFIALTLSYLFLNSNNKIYGILSGVFLGLSFLTKSISIGALIYVLGYFAFNYLTKTISLKSLLAKSVLVLTVFLATIFIFFPAMWVDFFGVLFEIFKEAERVGIRKGHDHVFFGQLTNDPGVIFYPLVSVLKISPFMLLGILFYLFSKFLFKQNKKEVKFNSYILFYLVFYLGYFVVMTYSTKKLDRYLLPAFPLFSLIAINGFVYAKQLYKNTKLYMALLIVSILLFIVIPIVNIFPYYFTYTSPIFGSTKNANSVLGQKSFGVGIVEVKDVLLKNYGDYPNVGFIDTKPIGRIYKNSNLFDIRVNGTRDYDIIVLAVNESFPANVLESESTYKKDRSIYINGLEYWTIYVKEN